MNVSLLVLLVHVQEQDSLVSEWSLLGLPVPRKAHTKAAESMKIQEGLKSSLHQNK